jgi:hypothetical protein
MKLAEQAHDVHTSSVFQSNVFALGASKLSFLNRFSTPILPWITPKLRLRRFEAKRALANIEKNIPHVLDAESREQNASRAY